MIVVVLGVEGILTVPTELVFAQGALHEFTPARSLNKTLAARTFLTPQHLVEIAEHAHLFIPHQIKLR